MTATASKQLRRPSSLKPTGKDAPPEVARTHAAWRAILRPRRPIIEDRARSRKPVPAVVTRWMRSFDDFFNDVGPCPERHKPTRPDASKLYGPGNFAWVPRDNRRGREPRKFSHDGMSLTLREWAAYTGVNEMTLRARLSRGSSFALAIQPTDYRKA